MAYYNLKAVHVQGYDLGAGSGNTSSFVFRPMATPCQAGIPSDYLGGPQVTSASFFPGDAASWFINPNTAQGQQNFAAGDMIVKSRSTFWFTLNATLMTGGVAFGVKIPVCPMQECWLPQNLTAISTVDGGNAFDTTQPIPASTTRLSLDYVVII